MTGHGAGRDFETGEDIGDDIVADVVSESNYRVADGEVDGVGIVLKRTKENDVLAIMETGDRKTKEFSDRVLANEYFETLVDKHGLEEDHDV